MKKLEKEDVKLDDKLEAELDVLWVIAEVRRSSRQEARIEEIINERAVLSRRMSRRREEMKALAA